MCVCVGRDRLRELARALGWGEDGEEGSDSAKTTRVQTTQATAIRSTGHRSRICDILAARRGERCGMKDVWYLHPRFRRRVASWRCFCEMFVVDTCSRHVLATRENDYIFGGIYPEKLVAFLTPTRHARIIRIYGGCVYGGFFFT